MVSEDPADGDLVTTLDRSTVTIISFTTISFGITADSSWVLILLGSDFLTGGIRTTTITGTMDTRILIPMIRRFTITAIGMA